MTVTSSLLPDDIPLTVSHALAEDVGSGDITASLIAADTMATATIVCREQAVLCGIPWAEEVARQVDSRIRIEWLADEGADLEPNQTFARLQGPARSLLTAERNILNFLQTLSGTATLSRHYAQKVAHTGVRVLDTRKTLPGLRNAQKYAVRTGGCFNHRMGLYDAFLIKENHISACGTISNAVHQARLIAPGKPVEVEVETFAELDEALASGADIIMLDNFSVEDMRRAVKVAREKVGSNCKLEASGGINEETLLSVAETGVDYISMGILTKDVRAVDLSMRFGAFTQEGR
ncbi:MAG TPA: carboxylating nicotinate-nucleotide diphosphorylase [Pseudohongiella sp.]|nr:carboxylating nicotinate-nucleotide diphosphorylase [Pseudohongiella sp.]